MVLSLTGEECKGPAPPKGTVHALERTVNAGHHVAGQLQFRDTQPNEVVELQSTPHRRPTPPRLVHGHPTSHIRRVKRLAFPRSLRVAHGGEPRVDVPAREEFRTLQQSAGVYEPSVGARYGYPSVVIHSLPTTVI